MQCPKCKASPLKKGQVRAKDLELDQCQQCKGMWFDKGELGAILGRNAAAEFCIPGYAAKTRDTACPRCGVGLFEFCYPGTFVLVDGCRQCEGVWLDNREWIAINYAREEKNYITCPACHQRQILSPACGNCGAILDERSWREEDPGKGAKRRQREGSNVEEKERQSYAADIPGVKGAMLRGIDHLIKRLTRGLFGS